MSREEEINNFLRGFFNYNYQKYRKLFDNLKNIYILATYLNQNMESLEVPVELSSTSRISLLEAENLIDGFYIEMEIDFKLNDVIKDGTFDVIRTNNPNEVTHHELTFGNNGYIGTNKSIEVYNNGLVTDTIIWVHEISHYRNQPEIKRGETNDILTELLAFTEELIYTDYLEEKGYEQEAKLFRLEEYQNLHNFIKVGTPFIKMYLLYFMLGEVSKENYIELYNDDDNYEKYLELFEKIIMKNQDAILTILWYVVGIISIYNYERYKEDCKYFSKIKKLDQKINENISLEEALKIIDIELNKESLENILKRINNFKDKIIEENNINKNYNSIKI